MAINPFIDFGGATFGPRPQTPQPKPTTLPAAGWPNFGTAFQVEGPSNPYWVYRQLLKTNPEEAARFKAEKEQQRPGISTKPYTPYLQDQKRQEQGQPTVFSGDFNQMITEASKPSFATGSTPTYESYQQATSAYNNLKQNADRIEQFYSYLKDNYGNALATQYGRDVGSMFINYLKSIASTGVPEDIAKSFFDWYSKSPEVQKYSEKQKTQEENKYLYQNFGYNNVDQARKLLPKANLNEIKFLLNKYQSSGQNIPFYNWYRTNVNQIQQDYITSAKEQFRQNYPGLYNSQLALEARYRQLHPERQIITPPSLQSGTPQ